MHDSHFKAGQYKLIKFEGQSYSGLLGLGFSREDAGFIIGLCNLRHFVNEQKQADVNFDMVVDVVTNAEGKPSIYSIIPEDGNQVQTLIKHMKDISEETGLPYQHPEFRFDMYLGGGYLHAPETTQAMKVVFPFVQPASESDIRLTNVQNGLKSKFFSANFTSAELEKIQVYYMPADNGRNSIIQITIPPETPALRSKAVAIAKDLGIDYPANSGEPLDINSKALHDLGVAANRNIFGMDGKP